MSPHHSPYAPGSRFGFEGDSGVQGGDTTAGLNPFGQPPCGDWAVQHQGGQTLQAPAAWYSVDHAQLQEPSSSLVPQPYPVSRGPAAGDMYMQTLCPSYAVVGPPHTLLTYTHAPLLTGFGTIPALPLPQIECPDTGLAYIPWGTPPLAAISTLPAPAVQLAACSAALPGSTLVHMAVSCPMPTPAVPHTSATETQVEVFQEPERLAFFPLADDAPEPGVHPQPHPHLKHPDPDTSQEQASGPLDHLVEPEIEPLNPLEKLLEDHDKGADEEESQERYSNSLFLTDI